VVAESDKQGGGEGGLTTSFPSHPSDRGREGVLRAKREESRGESRGLSQQVRGGRGSAGSKKKKKKKKKQECLVWLLASSPNQLVGCPSTQVFVRDLVQQGGSLFHFALAQLKNVAATCGVHQTWWSQNQQTEAASVLHPSSRR